MEKIIAEGYTAGFTGILNSSDNPWLAGTEEAYAWYVGYEQGQDACDAQADQIPETPDFDEETEEEKEMDF
jgi:hypothetical protein